MTIVKREHEDQCKYGNWFLVVGELPDVKRGARGMVKSVYPGGIIADVGNSEEVIRRADLHKIAFEVRNKVFTQ